jgi:hypothetical protein
MVGRTGDIAVPTAIHHVWELPAATCERGGDAPIRLRVEADVSTDAEPILLAVRLSKSGPGLTCGEKWAPTWAERAVTKLGWVGLPIRTILDRRPPVDAFSCACTEVSLGPKLWHLLRQTRP